MGSYELLIQPTARDELWAIPFPFRRHLSQRIFKLRIEPRPVEAVINRDASLTLWLSYGRIDYDVDDHLQRVTILTIFGP
jgi:hypothetical protein